MQEIIAVLSVVFLALGLEKENLFFYETFSCKGKEEMLLSFLFWRK